MAASDTVTELHELFVGQLRDILWAEKQLLKAIPKKVKLAKSAALKTAFGAHLAETEEQVARLIRIFEDLGLAPRAKKCDAMEGLLTEGDELAEEYSDSAALDAALICAAQKIEHYEIATYGTLRAFASQLGLHDSEKLIALTLKEETGADQKLSQIAMKTVNVNANSEDQ
ncbi:MAG: ferritin-like domain-containing protein [Planctomyces sp.]|nr:ferritin-like domain-containing protein [Planctomyces sp.]